MQYKYVVLINTTIAAFMALLDANIVLISLPTIVRELPGTTALDGIWVIIGYSLVTATLLLSFGRLADIYGRVRLYKFGFFVFTAGSALCSVATDGTFLVLSRLVQGTGAALIFSNSAAILTDAFPPAERGKALGINQVAGVSGSVLGLVAGGILTATLGWRSIFWINVPVGIYATLWAHYKLREIGSISKGERLDPAGNASFALGLTMLLLGLTLGAMSGWGPLDLLLVAAGTGLLALFLYAEKRAKNPMMDLGLFRIRAFAAGVTSNFLAAVARGAVSLLLVFYFQGALLLDPFASGVRILPFSLALVVAGPICGYLSDKYGSRVFVSGGLAVSALAYLWFATVPANVSYVVLAVAMLLAGAGGGMFVSPNTSSIMSSVPPTRRGIAAGTSATLFNVGYLISISLSFVVMASQIPLPILAGIFAGRAAASGTLNVDSFMVAMHVMFAMATVISVVAVVPSFMGGRKRAG